MIRAGGTEVMTEVIPDSGGWSLLMTVRQTGIILMNKATCLPAGEI